MTRWTFAIRFDGDDPVTVWFALDGAGVKCMVPGCVWTHPTRDEPSMRAHAKDEWDGKVEYPFVFPDYRGPHTAGEDCPCRPQIMIRVTGDGTATPYVQHNASEDPVSGLRAQRIIERWQQTRNEPTWETR